MRGFARRPQRFRPVIQVAHQFARLLHLSPHFFRHARRGLLRLRIQLRAEFADQRAVGRQTKRRILSRLKPWSLAACNCEVANNLARTRLRAATSISP